MEGNHPTFDRGFVIPQTEFVTLRNFMPPSHLHHDGHTVAPSMMVVPSSEAAVNYSLQDVAYSEGLAEVTSRIISSTVTKIQATERTPRPQKRKKKTDGEEPPKRMKNEKLWKCNVRKERKNKGESYVGSRGRVVQQKQFREAGCKGKCQYKCGSKVSREERLEIFNNYWGCGDYVKQREFIGEHILRVNKHKSTKCSDQGDTSRRKWTIEYFFPVKEQKVRVCRAFFLNTLCISESTIRTVLQKIHDGLPWGMGEMFEDLRGKHQKKTEKDPPQGLTESPESLKGKTKTSPSNPGSIAVPMVAPPVTHKVAPPSKSNITQSDFLETVGLHTLTKELADRDRAARETSVGSKLLKGKMKKGRKSEPSRWKCNIRKRMRDTGQSYISTKGKQIKARVFTGAGCNNINCRYKCDAKISKEEREKIFRSYWQLGNCVKQRQYVSLHVKRTGKLSCTTKDSSRRKFTHWYYLTVGLQRNRVCRSFFLKTLGITEQNVRTVLDRVEEGSDHGPNFEERRGGKQGKKLQELPAEDEKYICDHVKNCGVPETFKATLLGIYELYKIQCLREDPPKQPVSEQQYRRIAKRCLLHPKKPPATQSSNSSPDGTVGTTVESTSPGPSQEMNSLPMPEPGYSTEFYACQQDPEAAGPHETTAPSDCDRVLAVGLTEQATIHQDPGLSPPVCTKPGGAAVGRPESISMIRDYGGSSTGRPAPIRDYSGSSTGRPAPTRDYSGSSTGRPTPTRDPSGGVHLNSMSHAHVPLVDFGAMLFPQYPEQNRQNWGPHGPRYHQ